VHLSKLDRAVGQFDLFGDQMAVEVLEDLAVEAGVGVEPDGVALAVEAEVVDEHPGEHLRLGVAQERLAAGAEGEVRHVVGAEVVQELRRLGAGQFQFGVVRAVEQGGGGTGVAVLGGGVAEVGGHLPAGVVGEDGSGLAFDLVQRRLLGHVRPLSSGAAERRKVIAHGASRGSR
jgi:hypothetical protein